MVDIGALCEGDRAVWEVPARADVSRERGASRLYWTTQDSDTAARAPYDKVASFNGFVRYDYPLA
ncbi:MAG TPA: hypothetical protein VK545_14945 [Streptomyces sp.]|nr:hypothetical protein [Streptomyces sp.]